MQVHVQMHMSVHAPVATILSCCDSGGALGFTHPRGTFEGASSTLGAHPPGGCPQLVGWWCIAGPPRCGPVRGSYDIDCD